MSAGSLDSAPAGPERWSRGDPGYEEARRGAVWNGRLPARFPELIVRAHDVAAVSNAVRTARAHGLQVAVRSGGHSWPVSYLRDRALLLDVSSMKHVSIDAEEMTAIVGPGVIGSELSEQLRPLGLFFPTGHCMTVGLGGYLLQGGFGWHSKILGPACASVAGVDVVTADGALVHASERENPDLFWAVRGSGPGFFGVVTRFWLKLHQRPRSIMRSTYIYPARVLDDVLGWANEIRASVAREIEAMVFLRRDLPGLDGEPGLIVMGPALTDDREQSRAALRLLDTCPALSEALVRDTFVDTEMAELMAVGDALLYPLRARYEVDNMWTNAATADLLPAMRRIRDGLPSAPSHMMWMLWGQEQMLPDMAFSMQGELYIALYGVGFSPDTDVAHSRWVTENMRALEDVAHGIQLADENLARRPFRFMSEDAFARLGAVRARWDPEARFVSYMATPGDAAATPPA